MKTSGIIAAAFLVVSGGCNRPLQERTVRDLPRLPSTKRPQLVLQLGHREQVHSLAFSTSGRLLATSSDDGTVKLWDTQSWELLHTLAANDWTGMMCLAFSPNDKVLATGGGDQMVKLWDTRRGVLMGTLMADRPLRLLRGDGWVYSVAFSPDGRTLACGIDRSVNGRYFSEVMLWNFPSHKTPRTIRIPADRRPPESYGPWYPLLHTRVRFLSSDQLLVGSAANANLTLLGARTLRQVSRLSRRKYSPVDFAIVPGQRQVVFPVYRDDVHGGITIVGLNGSEVREFSNEGVHVDWLTVSLDGRWVAGGGVVGAEGERPSDVVWLWDTREGSQRRLTPHDDVTSVAFSPDGRRMALGAATGGIHIVKNPTGRLIRDLPYSRIRVSAVAWSPDGKTLACASGRSPTWEEMMTSVSSQISAWDRQTGRLRWVYGRPGSEVRAVAFSPDSRVMAAGVGRQDYSGVYGQAMLWDPASGKLLKCKRCAAEEVDEVAFSPDNHFLATRGSQEVTVWALGHWDNVLTIGGVSNQDIVMSFAPHGRLLATAYNSGWRAVRVWRVRPKRATNLINRAIIPFASKMPTGVQNRLLQYFGDMAYFLPASLNRPLAIAFSADGTKLAVGNSQDKRGHFFGEIGVWSVVNPRKLLWHVSGLPHGFGTVAFSPDGLWVAANGGPRGVDLWDAKRGVVGRRLVGHLGHVLSIAFSPRGKAILTGSWDGTCKIWNPTTGRLLVTLMVLPGDRPERPSRNWVAYTPEGYYDGSFDIERYIRWRVGDRLVPAEAFAKPMRRPDLVNYAMRGAL